MIRVFVLLGTVCPRNPPYPVLPSCPLLRAFPYPQPGDMGGRHIAPAVCQSLTSADPTVLFSVYFTNRASCLPTTIMNGCVVKDCSCASVCYNCATLSESACRCDCSAGWYSADCSLPCLDTHQYCAASPGWPSSWCDRTYVQQGCPAMCQLCTPADPDAKQGLCEPVYGSAAISHINIHNIKLITSLTAINVLIVRRGV